MTERTIEEDLSLIASCWLQGADIVEIRLDHLKEGQVRSDDIRMIREMGLLTILTLRPKWEGGHFNGSESERCELLREAILLEPDHIDIELGMDKVNREDLVNLAKETGVEVILSYHDPKAPVTEDVVVERIKRCWEEGADISKVVFRCDSIDDFITILNAGSLMGSTDQVFSLMGMGPFGHLSRIFAGEIGSNIVYCSHGDPLIEGQISIEQLRSIWRTGKGGGPDDQQHHR